MKRASLSGVFCSAGNLSRLLCGAILASPFFSARAAEEGMQWKRIPELLVPFVASAPDIDGSVDRKEWLAAAGLGPFKVGQEGRVDGLQRTVWICHDGKRVYLGFRFERPRDTLQPATPAETGLVNVRDESLDAAEAVFAPKLNFQDVYDFWLHANGAFGDPRCASAASADGNIEWERAARVTDRGWEGEMAIPFSAFGLSAPPDAGEWWGFDFVDQRATPFRLPGHWSYRGRNPEAYENLGRIRFGQGPAVRLAHAGETSDGRQGLEFAVTNPQGEDARLKVTTEILARKPDENSASKSYFDDIDSGLNHDAQAEFTKGSTLDRLIASAETYYESLPGVPKREEEIVVPAGQRRTAGLGAALPVGEYLARYRVEDSKGGVLAAGTTVFKRETPLALRVEPYWLYSQMVDVFADLGKVGSFKGGELVVDVFPAEGEPKSLRTVRSKVPQLAGEVKVELGAQGILPGYYRLQAVLLDETGKELARSVLPIQRPETPEWYKNDHGNRTEVPEPWTPLEADARGKVKVWGRTYDLSGILPATAMSQGKAVLASPVQLLAETPKGQISWRTEKVVLKEQSTGHALYEVAMSGGGLRVFGTMRVEFDGLIWYDLQIAPLGQPIEVRKVTLEIPVTAGLSELMGRHKFLVDPALDAKPPVPELNGAPGLLEVAKFPFTPYVWIGNEQAGMGFVAEAPIDWSINAPNRVLETLPAGKNEPGRILVHMVQEPKKVGIPMRLQFGLQATPIRETPKDHSVLNIIQRFGVEDDEKVYEDAAKRGCKVFVYYYGWRGNDTTELGGTPERPVDPTQRERLKRGIELAHKHGLKVIMYSGWGLNATSPNWKKFSYELGKYPIENNGWGTFKQSAGSEGAYVDFMAWGHADIAREYGADGVLWDSTANLAPDGNLRIGNAWVDEQGRVRPKYAVLATRDLYRRIYNIYHGEVAKNGIIYNHCGSMWPINVFADMQNRGEGRPMSAKTLRESWVPFEEFRSEYSAEPFGTLYSGEINDWAKLPMRVSTHLAVTLLHGTYAKEHALMKTSRYRSYAYEARPVLQLWDTFAWLPMNGEETGFYYYQNLKGKYQAVKAVPSSLLSSAFVSGDKKRAMIVVSNLDTAPVVGAKVELDLRSLGMASDRAVKIEDGVTLEPISADGNAVTLDIDQQRYRVLKVSVEES